MNNEETVPVTIEKLISGGRGMARWKGQVLLVPFVLPGEEVDVRILIQKKDYLLGEAVAWKSTHASRVKAPCPWFGQCGGCHLQMADYPLQTELKSQILAETLLRNGGISVSPLPPVSAPEPYHYRQRVKLQTGFINGRPMTGFYRAQSRALVPVDHCEILKPELNSLIEEINRFLSTQAPSSPLSGEWHGVLSPDGKELLLELRLGPHPPVPFSLEVPDQFFRTVSGFRVVDRDKVLQARGKQFFEYSIPHPVKPGISFKFRSGFQVFSQANDSINLKLAKTLLEWTGLSGKEKILELYAGNGNFTLFLSDFGAKVTAIEENLQAANELQINLVQNQLGNVSVRRGSTGDVLKRWDVKREKIDLLVADPPREGMDPETLRGILRILPPKIYYISCDPVTLARDLKKLSVRYQVQKIVPFDMFPQTAHLETLTELTLKTSE